MLVLGITGGVATGKSTVARFFGDLGAPIVSADALAAAVLAPGTETTRAVLTAFPDCADPADPVGHAVLRRALGRRVMADPEARLRLEALTHPPIIAELARQIALWRSVHAPRAGVAEVPLLFEAGLETMVDRVLVAACAEDVQIDRLRARLQIDAAEARRWIAAQRPLDEKIARADFVVRTDLGLDETRRQVAACWRALEPNEQDFPSPLS